MVTSYIVSYEFPRLQNMRKRKLVSMSFYLKKNQGAYSQFIYFYRIIPRQPWLCGGSQKQGR